jgi:hypothetical protein
VPAATGEKASDVTAPLPATGLVDWKAGVPVHVGLFGPNRVKVTVPVGLVPPLSVAVSVI